MHHSSHDNKEKTPYMIYHKSSLLEKYDLALDAIYWFSEFKRRGKKYRNINFLIS